jgi:hypothetical protein
MFFEDIDHWPAQRRDAIHARLNRSRRRFRTRLLGDVLLQQCFKVNLFMYLPELLLRKVGGENVVKKWLKRIYVTVFTSEVKENRSG